MVTMTNNGARRRGRPLGFNKNDALRKAMIIFWEFGYEGTSVNDLVEGMGITLQSFYTAFKSKANTYCSALELYHLLFAKKRLDILNNLDVFEAFHAYSQASVKDFSSESNPKGCMVCLSALTCGREHEFLVKASQKMRLDTISNFNLRIIKGINDGQLKTTTPNSVAFAIGAVIQGISIQARDGVSTEKLLESSDYINTYLKSFSVKKNASS
ncbi:TetR family transcriptional regulator [Gallaecimonas pentaromativorans]|uniref:TetR family transcriptional regulator n=2 Tax=Gallaecimonas pentaromativorans TaxID=584787 RepID=A0A3N1P0Z5_9GAMM|nr:TetR family transcriptional regulator [Gallaecimonas pentaromativorans]